jgi:hypothetical protein
MQIESVTKRRSSGQKRENTDASSPRGSEKMNSVPAVKRRVVRL